MHSREAFREARGGWSRQGAAHLLFRLLAGQGLLLLEAGLRAEGAQARSGQQT